MYDISGSHSGHVTREAASSPATLATIVSEKHVVSILMPEFYRKDAGACLPDHTAPYPRILTLI